jgi:hypothetical protein
MKKTPVGRPKVKERRMPVTFMAGGAVYNEAIKKHGKKFVNHSLELTVLALAQQEKSK